MPAPRPGDRGNRPVNRSGVTVTGNGSAAAPVDRVTVTFSISETRPDAGQAFRAAAETATLVLGILADDGADSRSVRTADLTLGPHTQWRNEREHLLGYQATQRLIVSMDGLSRVERMLSDVAGGGGNGVRIEGVALTPSDPAAALVQAREAAVADARAKAEHYAELVGLELGAVRWLEEGANHVLRAEAFGSSPMMAAAMPIAGGDAVLSAAVVVHWELADRADPSSA